MKDNNWNDSVESSMSEIAKELGLEDNFVIPDEESFQPKEEKPKRKRTTKAKSTTTKTNKEEEINEELKFNNVLQETESSNKSIKKEASTVSPKDFLGNLKFDINDIMIVEQSPMEKFENFEFVLNNKSKTQIVANQSNYIAYMEGLNYDEISSLTNSSLDDYAAQLLLVQTIHKKMNTSTIGKPSFEDWCKMTSFFDIDNFLYGIYKETFPGSTKFTITCGKCENKIDADINNDSIVFSKDAKSYANIEKILNNKKNPQELIKDALINKTERIVLNDSKMVFDIKVPTIKKQLDIIGSINKKFKDKTAHILQIMMFLEKLMMIDVKQSMQTNKPCYFEITDKTEIAKLIAKLSFNDAKQIRSIIDKLVSENAVEYKISSFKCPKCGEDIGDIPVEMENLLFYQILQP